ncbi:hypothetical protein FYJ44_08470 [Desulfovibrio sp. PG-178-WT-4]|uniref:Uncharacterized protein n=1 Tax=Desulfovibrio porci TaxID=2605782 RepID=A0A6L5XLK1_9BACT|nr:hypothetical protein [Desulfovibrio porci]MDY3808823.1 hypothetical protein [Desulfovibrio porci]MSS28072.1 hypothetical protein [Desulfovibrio porci]
MAVLLASGFLNGLFIQPIQRPAQGQVLFFTFIDLLVFRHITFLRNNSRRTRIPLQEGASLRGKHAIPAMNIFPHAA